MGRILCVGDSNTYGYDPRSSFGGRYPEAVRWTGRLRAEGWDVVNCGQNGREIPTRERQLAAMAQMLREEQPLDLVMVMLGSNDLLNHPAFNAEDVTARLETFLSYIKSAAPQNCLLLTAPPPMKPGEWVREDRLLTESARLGRCYGSLASRLGILFTDAGKWGVELCFDGVHFSAEGHRAFAAGVCAQISLLKLAP